MGLGALRFAVACVSTSQGPSRSSSEHSPPPRALYALLRLYRSRPGICPLRRLLLGQQRRFSRLGGCRRLQLTEPVREDGGELLLTLEGSISPANLLRPLL